MCVRNMNHTITRYHNLAETGCQWRFRNYYCPKCRATGYKSAHAEGCDGTKLEITSAARFPKKNAPQKVWDKFYDKFVLQLDLKERLEQLDNDRRSKYKLRKSRIPRTL